MLRKILEHSCDQLLSEWYFRKSYHNIGSKQKEHENMEVSSTQNKGATLFSCLAHGV